MTSEAAAGMSNQLVERLSRADRRRLLAQAESVELQFGEHLCEAGAVYTHVYFPLKGFVSLVTSIAGHPPLEMGLIGTEGMLGATLLLGIDVSPLGGIVQGAGSALRLTAAQFGRELGAGRSLTRVMNRYLYVLLAQLSQTAACTCFHAIESRLARWLLMTHDRARSDHFHLTHQLLADMLGVRRSAVTIAAGTLQAGGLISYVRGEITIVDREGLEATACDCYRAVVAHYALQFPAP